MLSTQRTKPLEPWQSRGNLGDCEFPFLVVQRPHAQVSITTEHQYVIVALRRLTDVPNPGNNQPWRTFARHRIDLADPTSLKNIHQLIVNYFSKVHDILPMSPAKLLETVHHYLKTRAKQEKSPHAHYFKGSDTLATDDLAILQLDIVKEIRTTFLTLTVNNKATLTIKTSSSFKTRNTADINLADPDSLEKAYDTIIHEIEEWMI